MSDEPRTTSGNNNGFVSKSVVTAVVGALVGALMMMLFNSKATETTVASNVKRIDELEKRMIVQEQARAGDAERIRALESKVDDIWKVVVLGERVERQSR